MTRNPNQIIAQAPGMIFTYRLYPDGRSCFPYASDTIKEFFGVSPEEVITDATAVFKAIHSEDLEGVRVSIMESAQSMSDWNYECRAITPKGEQWLLGCSRPQKQDDGSILWSGFMTNISSRKKIEEELLKTTRLYNVTSQINEVVIRLKDQQAVFQEACRIAVDAGKFRFAWIGVVEKSSETVRPVASSGENADYLQKIPPISICGDIPEGQGPCGTSIREGRTVVNPKLAQSSDFYPWRDDALKIGFASCISLPIWVNGEVIGSFTIYSSVEDFFNASEIKLLEKVVSNISYAVEIIEADKKHKQFEERLVKSEAKFSAIANLSPDIISLLDEEGKIVFNSSAAFRIHGYTNKEFIGKTGVEFVHPDDLLFTKLAMQKVFNEPQGIATTQFRIRNKGGGYVWIESTILNEINNPHLNGFICISRDISQRKQLEDDLKQALAARNQFISIASHELKTPLTSLKLQLQMLGLELKAQRSEYSEAKLVKGLALSNRQVDRITALVEDLLDVTRIQTGKLNMKLEKLNLSEVLTDALDGFTNLFDKAKCKLSFKIEDNIMGIWDRSRIEQVFVNLISNALKYAPENPIEISLTQMNNHAYFRIKDHGPGIQKESQNKIFEPFNQGTKSQYTSGLGLGLYITKQIVEAHSGVIQLDSDIGQGAIFTVDLPLK